MIFNHYYYYLFFFLKRRENASKLASGRSVVDVSNKENDVLRNKSIKPQVQSKIIPNGKTSKLKPVLEEKKNRIVKAESVISLYGKDEVIFVSIVDVINLCSID